MGGAHNREMMLCRVGTSIHGHAQLALCERKCVRDDYVRLCEIWRHEANDVVDISNGEFIPLCAIDGYTLWAYAIQKHSAAQPDPVDWRIVDALALACTALDERVSTLRCRRARDAYNGDRHFSAQAELAREHARPPERNTGSEQYARVPPPRPVLRARTQQQSRQVYGHSVWRTRR